MKKTKSLSCRQKDLALKSFFLGPQSENSDWLKLSIIEVLDIWFQWRKDFKPSDGVAISKLDQSQKKFKAKQNLIRSNLIELNKRFQQEIPQFSPRYIGHMYSELALPAILGHFSALLHNPNIISSEAAPVGAQIEEEAINALAQMVGYKNNIARGHFTSGGTIANIEALWRARFRLDHFLSLICYLNLNKNSKYDYFSACSMNWTEYNLLIKKYKIDEKELRKYSPVANNNWKLFKVFKKAFKSEYRGPVVLIPNSKHYSWLKAVSLLGFGEESFWGVDLDSSGMMSMNHLQQLIRRAQKEDRPIAMIVSVAGTTELGEFDPIDLVHKSLKKLNLPIWHHVDAAYGGFFCSLIHESSKNAVLNKTTYKSLLAIKNVDSITLDPHKLGYVPYACGAIIVKNELNYRVSSFDAKYIQSPNKTIDRWMKTLEGSRSATGATATWLSLKTIGYKDYANILNRTIKSRSHLASEIEKSLPNIAVLNVPTTNLLCFSVITKKATLSEMNKKTDEFVNLINNSSEYMVSKTHLKDPEYAKLIQAHCQKNNVKYEPTIGLSLVRLTLMNPFFETQETHINYKKHFIQVLKELT